MSKYRFKKREEFIRDGLWNDEYNCPDEWAWEGQMNKYLGTDVPDELNIYCNKKEDFRYDRWYFQNTNYVLKEQQEYFDDLSQNIGRYIRALVDYPHSGGVKKGEIGKIISNYYANFPSQQEYNCSNALSKGSLGVKYELLPEDYSPEQEPNVEFIPGKWYSFNWDYFGKDRIVIAKIKVVEEDQFIISWRSYLWLDKSYRDNDAYSFKDISNIKELSIEEIQPYLPNGHPDKIINQKFEIGKWYKWYQKNHGDYHCGKVSRINLDTDTIVMSPWIIHCNDYNYSGTFDLSKAEQIQEISVEDIQEFLPNSHPDKITSDVFKRGEYIVIIKTIESYSKDFTSNYIYKQKEDYKYLRSELDNYGNTTNGWETIGKKDSHTWRYATPEEIDEYERRGKPYDVTELQKKELSMEEIQEECKKRFPIGCTYISTNGETHVLKKDSCTYTIVEQNVWAHSGAECLYKNGKWATLVSLPEENITEIPEYVECVSYFDIKYKGKIYNTTIDKPEINSKLTWYEILIDCGRLKDGSFKISNEEAYERQKSHIPEYIECTETQESYFIKGNIYKVIDSTSLSSARLMSNIELSQKPAGTTLFCLMEINGKKYWKPSTKEKYDQQKPLTYESVSGCFPTDKAMLIYDEVGQYPLTPSECWKNIPIFVEQEFDIYGSTPDIE